MAESKRRESREEVFRLLFETEFQAEKSVEEIFALAEENRDFSKDSYIRETYFGVIEKKEELDEIIGKHSNGWKASRIAPVLRNILRLGIYEMLYRKDVPEIVAMDEAIELTKKFGEEKEKGFVNGVLNSVMNASKSESEGK